MDYDCHVRVSETFTMWSLGSFQNVEISQIPIIAITFLIGLIGAILIIIDAGSLHGHGGNYLPGLTHIGKQYNEHSNNR